MNKVAIIAHTADRLGMLTEMLASAAQHRCLNGWRVVLVAQGYQNMQELKRVPHIDVCDEVIATFVKLGPHSARVRVLHANRADLYLSLDDDMVFLPESQFGAMEAKALEASTGFVAASNSTNASQAARHMPKLFAPVFREQRLVCTGGGLMFRDEVAQLVRDLPDRQYLFDDVEWPLAAYMKGHTNYRFFGSWAIHKAGRAGGRNGWFQQRAKVLPDARFIRLRHDPSIKNPRLAEENRVAFPADADVTPEAQQLHTTNRQARGWATGEAP